MEFRCRLATAGGEIIEGVYAADSEAKLRHEFEEKGLLVLQVRREGALPLGGLALPRRRKIGTREFLVFNQELATLLKAGMPLVQSLHILRQRVQSPLFKSVLDDVHEKVRAGTALSDAFAAHGALFPGIYTASLFAGEKSGNLEQVIRRFVAYMKIIGAVKRKTLSALVYPAILLTLSFVVVGIILVRVVPEFAAFYKQFNAELPLVTRLIVQASLLITTYLPLVLLMVVPAGIATYAWMQSAEQRARFDHVILATPLLGGTARKFATSQLARTLATLLGGGIPLVNALDTAARAMSNRYMAEQLGIVAQHVREGQALATAMEARHVFPDVAIKMVEVGESTGALQDMLNSLADFYDEEIETNLGRFVTLIEPILLVVMGIVIAGLLLALYMPLFQLSSVLGS
jgi:type IV pilus assembly protein PilC